MQRQILITKPDRHRLEQLIENRLAPTDAGVETLERKLERAIVVDPEKISKNVVTMNSRVRIHDLDRNVESVVSIVFPSESNAEQNRISVLAPLGTALLGSRVGTSVRFNAPGGLRRVKIIGIEYQPEAAGRNRVSSPTSVRDIRTAA
jgi:regulator of nucleoside diphosphate kinase